MARLALSVAGAVAGFFIGGPAGAQVGWMAGTVVGSLIPQNTRGPSVEEGATQTTAEGAPRAIVYGTAMVSGNVIDAGKTRKINRKQSQGKGGSSVTTEALLRTYAVRICEGPIGGILMVKKDGKIVYDIRPEADFAEDNAKFLAECRIYIGDESQLPDPDLEAIKGAGEVPAYRGSAYIVFVDDDVTDRRGSIPQYGFVVAKKIDQSPGGLIAGPQMGSRETWLDIDQDGNPYAISDRDPRGIGINEVPVDAQYKILTWGDNWEQKKEQWWVNAGDSRGDPRLWIIAARNDGKAVAYDGNFGYLKLVDSGRILGYVAPENNAVPAWHYGEPSFSSPDRGGGQIWMAEGSWYIALRDTAYGHWNRVCRFGYSSSTLQSRTLPLATIYDVNPDPSLDEDFAIHLSRRGKLRIYNKQPSLRRYSSSLQFEDGEMLPAGIEDTTLLAFGADDEYDLLATLSVQGNGARLSLYHLSNSSLIVSHSLPAQVSTISRIVFSESNIFIQHGMGLYSLGMRSGKGVPVLLSDIVSDISERCGVSSEKNDVSELVDIVDGLVLASAGYSGADAINTLRAPYFFDRAEWGGRMRYIKRGKSSVAIVGLDDLVEEPDESERQAQIEYPRKMHLTYQSASVNYETAQATSERTSPDVQVTGESAMQVPVVLTPELAAIKANVLHKVSWTEAEGEVKFALPDSWLRLVPSDCVTLQLRGASRRLRIDGIEHSGGVMQITAHVDRRSAYASATGYVPLPTPRPPVSSVVGESVLAVLDVPALRDDDDALWYYAAATGERDAWRGAQLQRSLDGGASYVDALGLDFAATMGRLAAAVPAASPWYTDRTNIIEVDLIRPGDGLDSVTDAQFLQRAGAIALQLPNGSWEVAQYRDAAHVSGARWQLSTLHRGQLATPAAEHAAGALLVLLDDVSRASAQSAWLQRVLTHRAPSYGGSVETAQAQGMTYAGRAQREWPVVSLRITGRSGGPVGGSLTLAWAPRHRLGTDVSPVASQHFRGFRVYVTDEAGLSTTQDVTAQSMTLQLGAMTWPVRVHVAAVNAITGAGPWRWVSTDNSSGEGDGPTDEEPGGEVPVGDGTFQRGLAMYGSARAGAFGQFLGAELFAAQNSGTSWQLFKLRADTLEVIRAVYAGPYLFAVINDGESLYGGSDGIVRKWDASLNEVAQMQVGWTGDAQGLALCGGGLWVSVPYEPAIKKLDPATLSVQSTVSGLRINSLVTDSTYLYGASRADNCIYKLDGSTGALVATFPTAAYPADLVVHAGKLWVTCLHDLPVRLYKHDATTGAKESFELAITSTPGRLAIAGDVLGVGGRVSFAINMLTDSVIGSFSIPLDSPTQLLPGGASIITPTRFIAGGLDWTAYYDLI